MIYSDAEFLENTHFQLRASFIQIFHLRDAGLRPDEPVRLRFRFEALHPGALHKLEAFLQNQTDCRTRIKEGRSAYHLVGTTRPTRISMSIMKTWVNWMCRAGEMCDCLFSGWKAQRPSARPSTAVIVRKTAHGGG